MFVPNVSGVQLRRYPANLNSLSLQVNAVDLTDWMNGVNVQELSSLLHNIKHISIKKFNTLIFRSRIDKGICAGKVKIGDEFK